MALQLPPSLSPASTDLGLGSLLTDQVAGETEEQRRKRMLEQQQQKLTGLAGSPATLALFGGGMRAGGAGGTGY